MQAYPPEHKPKSPEVSGGMIRITQGGDSCDGEIQSLELSSHDAGGGHFYVLETQRWAFDTLQEFIDVLKAIDAKLPKCEEKP